MQYFKLWTDPRHADLLDRVRYVESIELEHNPTFRREISNTEYFCGLCNMYKPIRFIWNDLVMIACNPSKYIFDGEIIRCCDCISNRTISSIFLHHELYLQCIGPDKFEKRIINRPYTLSITKNGVIYNISRDYFICLSSFWGNLKENVPRLRSENPAEYCRVIDLDRTLFNILYTNLQLTNKE
jgi:hypothetical protein